MLSRILFPKSHSDSVFTINYEKLYFQGIRLLLFDIDNTLVPFDISEPTDEIIQLMARLKKLGFKICLFSNNNFERVQVFAAKIPNVDAVPNAMKPLKVKYKEQMTKEHTDAKHTAMIGDQIFTDVLGGNRVGIYTILIKPISHKDEWITKIKRGIEQKVIDKYHRKRVKKNEH